jgi:hypothetical protein
MASTETPNGDQIADIAAKQDEKRRSLQASPTELSDAAETIQRNYRGYRERRQLKGIGLDPSKRWSEVCFSLAINALLASIMSADRFRQSKMVRPPKTWPSTTGFLVISQ